MASVLKGKHPALDLADWTFYPCTARCWHHECRHAADTKAKRGVIMPRHKADVHPKRRNTAMQMAKGDTGQNRLNDFFGVFTQSIDNMLFEFGLFKDQENRPGPAKKPLEGQESARPPSTGTGTESDDSGPTPAGQSLFEYIQPQAGNTGGTSVIIQRATESRPVSEDRMKPEDSESSDSK